MEEEKSLQSCALISQFSASVQNQINQLLAHSVVTSSIVVGCILLACDHLTWVEQISISSCSNLKELKVIL